jgi:hypothetical protein
MTYTIENNLVKLIVNYVTRAIMALLNSECTKAQMNREIRAAYAYISRL